MTKIFYHGTTDILKDKILRPALETNIIRETRSKNLNKVFVTISKPSAERYAKLASQTLGGNPIVLKVKPHNYSQINGTEYICDFATVLTNA